MQMDADNTDRKSRRPTKLIDEDLTYQLNGIFFRVHNRLGRFCSEGQYCDAIEQELIQEKILYERERVLDQYFLTERPGRNRVDFLIAQRIPIEIKTKRLLTREDYWQVRRYLTVLQTKLGILVNFRTRYLRPKRILNTDLP